MSTSSQTGSDVPFGISAALLTPFDADGTLDVARLATHARTLIDRGLDGVTPFGTTGEGASVTLAERLASLDAFRETGLPMERVTLGLAACAVGDALEQAYAARSRGVRSLLVPPPFYFPAPHARGVHDWYAALLAGLPDAMSVVLYHIPQITDAVLPADVAGRLHAAFPGKVRAIKDSSGDLATARAFLALDGPGVLIGDERLLASCAAEGAVGAISGMANIHPERLVRLLATRTGDAALDADVDAIVAHPVVPALKAVMARGDEAWAHPRPPLAPLDPVARETLLRTLAG